MLKKKSKMKNTMKKYAIIIFLSLILLPLASAEFLACFTKDQIIDYCNPKTQDRTCENNYGCTFCMKSYNSTKECYSQGNYNHCNHIPQKCTVVNGSTEFDFSPPNLTITSPLNGLVYNEKSILLNLSINELSNIYYTDLTKNIFWKTLCKNCVHFINKKSFNEGKNKIMFKLEDLNNNLVYYNLSFTIDTKKPRILSVIPRSGFSSGDFKIQFMEENPLLLSIEYGTEQEKRLFNVNLNNSCLLIKGKYLCNVNLNLSEFNGKNIYYKLNLTDIAFNTIATNPTHFDVDTMPPRISSLTYTILNKILDLNITIDEPNLKEVNYINQNSSIKIKRRLCSSLKNGLCAKKILLQKGGINTIQLILRDKAGNVLIKDMSVIV